MKFRSMRRVRQELPTEESLKILENSTAGVLAVLGDEDYPYAVPLSFVYHEGKIYFHSAKEGHKLDALKRSAKVSFCVIDRDEIVPEEYTTYFRSVIAFGQAEIVTDPEEQKNALLWLAEKYYPADSPAHRMEHATGMESSHTAVIRLIIEHCTGKEAKELMGQRKNSAE